MPFPNYQVPLLSLLESVYYGLCLPGPQDLVLHFIHTMNVLSADKTSGRKYLLFVFYNQLMEHKAILTV